MRWATWLIGALLVVFGVVVLIWGGIPLGEREHGVEAGPIEMRVEEERRAAVPAWAGVVAIVAGAGVLAVGSRAGGSR